MRYDDEQGRAGAIWVSIHRVCLSIAGRHRKLQLRQSGSHMRSNILYSVFLPVYKNDSGPRHFSEIGSQSCSSAETIANPNSFWQRQFGENVPIPGWLGWLPGVRGAFELSCMLLRRCARMMSKGEQEQSGYLSIVCVCPSQGDIANCNSDSRSLTCV
jgi:hypothetical protein